MACMFCGSELELTREHVFPAFMGSTLQVPDGSCKGCNGRFAECEGTIKDATETLLRLLQIENRDGIVPSATVDIKIPGVDIEGLSGLRKPSGDIKLLNKVVTQIGQDGKRRRAIFTSEKDAQDFMKRARARGEKTIEYPMPDFVALDASSQTNLAFAGMVDTRRVVAKIALSAISWKYGVAFALSSHFDKLRGAATDFGRKQLPVRLFANQAFMAVHTRNIHHHSVICYLSAGRKKGWAVVTLFGGVTYLVNVSADYQENCSLSFSIFFDSASKRRFNPIVLVNEMSMIDRVLSRETEFESKAIDAQWEPILAAYCRDRKISLVRKSPPKESQ